MAVCRQTRTPIITLKFDISKAHRRTAVPKHEWKYLVVTLYDSHGTPEWWVNLAHTYGVASAQHYWGRTAALFLRLLYQVLGPELQYGYVFVGDYSLLVRDINPTHTMMMTLLFLETYGVPIAYHKIYIGHSETWVGFLVHLKTH